MKRKIVLLSLLIMVICSWAQPYPESSYEIDGGYLMKWKGTETEIDFTKDPVLKNIYRIYSHAFQNNTTLEKVIFSKNIVELGGQVFENCEKLKEVTFEESESEVPFLDIYSMTFYKCPQLEKIHLPRQYKIPGADFNGIIWGGLGEMFEECDAVSSITVSSNHPTLRVYNGAVYNKDRTQLFYVPSGTTGDFTVPTSVKELYNYTFYNSHLSSVFLPADIEEIPKYCFQDAKILRTIALPRNLRTIKYSAFSDCVSLRNLIFPNGLENIEEYAFWKCTSLSSVLKLPASLQKIDGRSFGRCDQIKEFSIPNGAFYTAVDGVLFSSDLSTLVLFPGKEGKYEVPAGTVKLGKGAFCRAIINDLKLPTSLREIEDESIVRCDKLAELRIPEGVTEIGKDCIHSCEILKYIELPSTLERIGSWSLIDVHNKEKQYKVICHAVYPPQAKGMLCNENNKGTLYVPQESVELYKITPNWKKMSQILPITGDIIPSKYVLSEDRSTLLRWKGDDKDVNFADYPDLANVTTIAASAFAGNTSLETLIADNVQKIENGTEDIHGAFEAATSLKDVSLTALTSVGDRAFAKCTALKNVSLSYSTERLGNYAFAYCTAMEEYPYFSSLKSIDDFTFINNNSLRAFMFSPLLQQIGEQAFANNTALSELTSFAVTPPVLSKNVFLNVPVSKVNLNIPTGAENAYRNAEQWKVFFNSTGIDKNIDNVPSFHIDGRGLSIYGTPQCSYRIYDTTGKIIVEGKLNVNGRSEICHQQLSNLSSVFILGIQDSRRKIWKNFSFFIQR